MSRQDNSKTLLESLIADFNASQENKILITDIEDHSALQALLDNIYRIESIATRKKAKFDFKASQNLRSVIADVLLLQEGVDYQNRRKKAYESLDTPPEIKQNTSTSI